MQMITSGAGVLQKGCSARQSVAEGAPSGRQITGQSQQRLLGAGNLSRKQKPVGWPHRLPLTFAVLPFRDFATPTAIALKLEPQNHRIV